MGKISFPDFWKHYKGTPEQKEAIVILESMMPSSLLQDESSWVVKFRKSHLHRRGLSLKNRWDTSCSAHQTG